MSDASHAHPSVHPGSHDGVEVRRYHTRFSIDTGIVDYRPQGERCTAGAFIGEWGCNERSSNDHISWEAIVSILNRIV